MNKKILSIHSIIFLVLGFLSHVLFSEESNASIPEPDKIVHEIMDKTIDTLSQKYGLHPCGIGMNGKFEYLEISFQVFHPLSKDKAREMLFDCINELLANVNTNEEIRPYLKDYPFNYKNVGIVFYIRNEKNEKIFHPEICVARSSTSGVFFRTKNPINPYEYKENYEETHEEALKLLQDKKITFEKH